jgi:tRNA (mo5U34)-methyltransferase
MSETKRFDLVRDWQRELDSFEWWHSFELPDGTQIRGVNTLEGQINRLAQFPIPDDLRGKRVLDIGAWDGWFSFEMERRGAEVMAIDVWDNPRFHRMHELLGSRVDYRVMDVYDLAPSRVGRFDIVLFLAVLYHLKHPLLALERVCSVTTDLAAVDSFVLKEEHRRRSNVDTRPIMEFYESDEFGGQTDNWVGPSLPALMAFCRTAGFARVELGNVLAHSACVVCYRTWGDEVDASQAAPQLTSAFHNTRGGINFSSERDEYVTIFFETPNRDLGRDLVQPEVSGFGTKPIYVGRLPDGAWQANFKLPPGLEAGWHPVQVRVKKSHPSNSIAVAIDVPVPDRQVAIESMADGATWTPNQLRRSSGNALVLWVDGLPRNADQNTVRVLLGDRGVPVRYVDYPGPEAKPRQVNVEIPDVVPTGRMDVRVVLGTHTSDPAPVEILP